jgi:hypothetical protein
VFLLALDRAAPVIKPGMRLTERDRRFAVIDVNYNT